MLNIVWAVCTAAGLVVILTVWNGGFDWLFVVTGVLVVLCAHALDRAVRRSRGEPGRGCTGGSSGGVTHAAAPSTVWIVLQEEADDCRILGVFHDSATADEFMMRKGRDFPESTFSCGEYEIGWTEDRGAQRYRSPD
ncbi:hypothetical protein [Pseudonocardia sp. ICBG1142]|uniref:hypothetical protein n=1 Tax=Pseudonocardia sp. ICBG1142 TaxID=2846760 RepID=UPI001CF65C18|nr:hypothetical protein [Pseudonocardia sp. ICBG1142]